MPSTSKPVLDERAELDRVVDQLLVSLGGVAAEPTGVALHGRQRGRDFPVGEPGIRRPFDGDVDARALGANRPIEHRRAVEEPAPPIEVRLAHGFVEGVDAVLQHQRSGAGRAAQAGLVDALERQRRVAASGLDLGDVLGEIAHQIAAADPRRHAEQLSGGIRLLDFAAHAEQVRAGVGDGYGEVDHGRRDCSGGDAVSPGRTAVNTSMYAPYATSLLHTVLPEQTASPLMVGADGGSPSGNVRARDGASVGYMDVFMPVPEGLPASAVAKIRTDRAREIRRACNASARRPARSRRSTDRR